MISNPKRGDIAHFPQEGAIRHSPPDSTLPIYVYLYYTRICGDNKELEVEVHVEIDLLRFVKIHHARRSPELLLLHQRDDREWPSSLVSGPNPRHPLSHPLPSINRTPPPPTPPPPSGAAPPPPPQQAPPHHSVFRCILRRRTSRIHGIQTCRRLSVPIRRIHHT